MPTKPALPPAVLRFMGVMAAVFAAEALVMLILTWLLPALGNWLESLVDSALLTLLITPLFWRWLVVSDRGRRRAEESLLLQSVALTAAANAIVITDRDGTIVWVNPAFTTLTGYTFAESVGKNPRDLVKSNQQERAVYQNLWETILAGRVWHGELINRRKDGNLYSEEMTIAPMQIVAGEITHFIAIQQDLTERKRAEAALRTSEERFKTMFVQAPLGIALIDSLTGHIYEVNPRFAEIAGRSLAEMANIDWLQITHPDDVQADLDNMALLNAGKINGFQMEKRYLHPDGTAVWINMAIAPLKLEDKAHPRHLCMVQDITARKLAERQLRDQNDILSNSHEGLMVVNLANQVTLWNHGAEETFGWTPAEALGRLPEQLLGVDDPGIVSTLRAAVERDGFWNGELRSQTREGRKIIVNCRVSQVRDKAGQPRARLHFFADITEKKQLEEKFLHAQRLESIGMLAAGIAHDLNNVLAPIVFAAPLLRGSLSAPRDLKVLDTLEQCAGRGAGLVKQILGFAHTATGEFRPTQVKHLLRDIISLIEETFPKSIQLEHQILTNLWPVQGNATQIHQVFLNLCVNARDAMPQGGTLRIVAANRRLDAAEAGAISGGQPGAWLVLEVTDTGTGITPEVLERIWTPFFTTKGIGKGTGLGLSTVRGIVVSHHGFVELHTKVGRGTTFRVFLPAIIGESSRPSSATPVDIPDGHGELILVVDDNGPIRDMVSEILGNHGYRVVGCVDGVEAIALFSTHFGGISLVVTDVDMPRVGGVALAHALLQLCPGIRLLAMSGLSSDETKSSDVAAVQKLAHAFLLKPFTQEDLLGTVHRLLHPPENP